jgi:preprotein translocase subunit YajC
MLNLLFAQEAQQPQPQCGVMTLLPLLLIFVVIYLLMIMPQQRRQKKHQEMLKGLEKGDKVVTSGGIYGEIVRLKEDRVVIKSAGTLLEVAKQSITEKG